MLPMRSCLRCRLRTQRLLPAVRLNDRYANPALNTRDQLELKLARQIHSPYTSILLWFDREITDLDHAWLLDSTIEWFFISRVFGDMRQRREVTSRW